MGAIAAQENDLDEEDRLSQLISPGVSVEDLEAAIFQLCYKQHGGSGTNMTADYVDRMDWRRFTRWLKMLEEQRAREQRELEKAARKR